MKLTLDYCFMPIGLAFSCLKGDLEKANAKADLVKIKQCWAWRVQKFHKEVGEYDDSAPTMFDGLTQRQIAERYIELAEDLLYRAILHARS
jgi:hypothetical protein